MHDPTELPAADLDPAERRLVERVLEAVRCGAVDDALKMRVRNRAELYRELARRTRFDGAAAAVPGVAARGQLFETLLRRIEAQSPAAD